MTKYFRALSRGDDSFGTVFVAAATVLIACAIALTGARDSPLLPLIHLPVILAVVRCRFREVVAIGVALALFTLLLCYGPHGFNAATADWVRAATLFGMAVVGGLYAQRIQTERVELRHTVEEQEALLNVSQNINAAENLGAALDSVLLLLRTFVPDYHCAAIYLADDSHKHVRLAAVSGLPRQEIGLQGFSLGMEQPSLNPEDAERVYIRDTKTQADSILTGIDRRAGSALWICLRSLNVPIGSLYISAERTNAFSPQQVRMVAAFADRIGFPLQKLRVQEGLIGLAYSDPMTGLYNFRAFRKHLDDELKRASRYSRPLSLVILDLDGFKLINDHYGHPAGDRLLAEVASILRASVRETDLPARYGGEEFVVICPETDEADASVVAERVRASVEAALFDLGGSVTCKITCSAGIATYPDDATTETELIRAADAALYDAKAGGKNRVVRALRPAVRR